MVLLILLLIVICVNCIIAVAAIRVGALSDARRPKDDIPEHLATTQPADQVSHDQQVKV